MTCESTSLFVRISSTLSRAAAMRNDSMTILRSCVGPEPGKLIKGISSDFNSAWKCLDQSYGYPRVISDIVTGDLEKLLKQFNPVKTNVSVTLSSWYDGHTIF